MQYSLSNETSQAAEEVDVRKFLHLLDIATLRNLLVIEQDPSRALRVRIGQALANERDVVPVSESVKVLPNLDLARGILSGIGARRTYPACIELPL